MRFFINTRSGVPLYKQIYQQVEKGIMAGILVPGKQLPTVREVAVSLTVNPNTVARAYRELEYDGLIESIQGRGTFVSTKKPAPAITDREEIIRRHFENLFLEAEQLKIDRDRLEKMFKELFNRHGRLSKQNE